MIYSTEISGIRHSPDIRNPVFKMSRYSAKLLSGPSLEFQFTVLLILRSSKTQSVLASLMSVCQKVRKFLVHRFIDSSIVHRLYWFCFFINKSFKDRRSSTYNAVCPYVTISVCLCITKSGYFMYQIYWFSDNLLIRLILVLVSNIKLFLFNMNLINTTYFY